MGNPSPENIIIFFLEVPRFGAFYYHPCNHYLWQLALKYALGNYLQKIPNPTRSLRNDVWWI